MDFELDDAVEAFRSEVRDFLDRELTPELAERVYRTGVSHDPVFVRRLAERGWTAPAWADRPDGRPPLDPWQVHAMVDEMVTAEAPTVAMTTTAMVANVIRLVGGERLRAEILPRFARGEITIALGLTEPEAGSDVAAVRTTARPDGSGWVIDGQKMFTTNGHLADFVFLLTRTDPQAPQHRGLTLFLVRLDKPGVEAQAVYTVSGERTNILFFNDVVVGDDARIGDVNAGWSALMVALQDEHSASFSGHLARLLAATDDWADRSGRARDPDVEARSGKWAARLEVARLLEQRVTWMETKGRVPVAEGPMAKLFSTESLIAAGDDLTELVGPDAVRSKLDPTAVANGLIEHAMRFSLGTAIYAGTSEIQRTIIARSACGLPRPR